MVSTSTHVCVLQRGGQFTINRKAPAGGCAAASWWESRGPTPSAVVEVMPQPTCHFSMDAWKVCQGIYYLLPHPSAQVGLHMEGSCSAAGHTFQSILNYNNAACSFFLSLLNTRIRLKNKQAEHTIVHS